MDKQQAQQLVRNTFENTFDKNGFTLFVKNLLNRIEEDSFTYQGKYIPDAYKQHITTLERIGKYTDGEHKIDILIVHLKKETSIERARTMQRNFIAWYLNGSRGGELKDAALAAFVSPNEDDWRFSLVKMDYRFEEGKNGRTRVKEEFTPARRWSFLVGKNESSHTAKSRLVPIIEDDEHNPTLARLEHAFIEKVTEEFFEKYRDLFLRTKETLDAFVSKESKVKANFEAKGVNTVDFAKKLLGQIVFLSFLQKKGWFGVKRDDSWGTGPKNFLRELFERKHGNYYNFFNDILEPLFYEALSRERDDNFYSRFNCKIPFLNGGLFDPIGGYDWVHTDILLPDNLFSNTYKTKEGDTGNGILDIFDRYNFTVKEDEPLEKEVAVDPEMLGKVFEKLGAITAEKFDEWANAVRSGNRTKELEANKKLAVYYTPREIVHYMCQQSIINYLSTELDGKVNKNDSETLIKYGEQISENEAVVESKGRETGTYSHKLSESIRQNAKLIDDKLANIKVCDPAIGSGAFPVGMMSEIVKARTVLSNFIKEPDRNMYHFKRECIERSLYGVDIDQGAVEIAKLRLWLSLVVDEEEYHTIKPLPNLDYKVMQGNSLLEEYEGVRLFDEKLIFTIDLDKEKQIVGLKEKQAELSSEYIRLHQADKLTWEKKAQIDEELKKISSQIKIEQSGKNPEKNATMFDLYNSTARKKADELKRLHKEFFETTQKGKKDELKKQIENLEWDLIETTLREQSKTFDLKKLEALKKANIKPFFLWRLHFSEVFQEKGGFDVVIGNPPYGTEISAPEKQVFLRQYHHQDYQLDSYLLFMERGFDLLHTAAVLAFIIPNTWLINLKLRKIRRFLFGQQSVREIVHYSRKVFAATVDTEVVIISKEIPTNNRVLVRLVTNAGSSVDRFVEQQKWALLDGKPVNIFANSQQDAIIEKMRVDTALLGDICDITVGMKPYQVGKGIPKQTRSVVESRIFDSTSKKDKTYRALLRGRDIDRYVNKWNGERWIKYGPHLAEPRPSAKFDASIKIVIRQTGDSLVATLDGQAIRVHEQHAHDYSTKQDV
ncbi:Eco57I restriction-modification methylase domain-containing protein [bacterium]|nr:Eco57I restriction-modification methylase domain-containing protein [bacterium]MBU1752511.1 Eco57I restriction-modification methylase domain-containing protein [bacterium]